MSEMQDTGNPNEWINWIEKAISEKSITYFEFEDFSNFQKVGSGAFGKVYRVNWTNSEQYLGLKCFFNVNNVTIREVIREVIIVIIYLSSNMYISNLKFMV